MAHSKLTTMLQSINIDTANDDQYTFEVLNHQMARSLKGGGYDTSNFICHGSTNKSCVNSNCYNSTNDSCSNSSCS